MCSHIFVAMGMWDDVVEANEAAVKITGVLTPQLGRPRACGHYPSWLTYGYLQQGRIEAAKAMVQRVPSGRSARRSNLCGAAFMSMRARYLIDTEDWSGDIAALPVSPTQPTAIFTYEFTNAFGALRRGDVAAARASLARMDAARQTIEAAARKPLTLRTPACPA